MDRKYNFKTNEIPCDFLNKNIIMTTEYCCFSGINKIIEKRCSEWENCENREYCKYRKI